MIAVELFFGGHVAKELEKTGSRKVEQIDDELSLWVTPWEFYFTVPEIGPDRMCPRATLFEILADIERMRPPQH